MTHVSTLGFIIMIVGCALAKTPSVPQQSCSSSTQVRINVTHLSASTGDLYVDLYRMKPGGEMFYRSEKANARGVATLSDVPEGKYRVFADNGRQGAEMLLLVKKGGSAAPCEMKFSIPGNLFHLYDKTVVIKDLQGVVQSSTGVAIPKAKITLRRNGAHEAGDITFAETDHDGKFLLPKLAEGWYGATVEPPKDFYQFCRISIQVKVASDGWRDVKLTLAPLIDVAPGYCERASSLEELNAKEN